MFIETHIDEITAKSGNKLKLPLTFIRSKNVHAYPCGRRRSTEIDKDGDLTKTINDKYYFPFDPEARLNTEANNRKHSSLNGFTQTYIKDFEQAEEGKDAYFILALNGYLFKIKQTNNTCNPNYFGDAIITSIVDNLAAKRDAAKNDPALQGTIQAEIDQINAKTRIYANILLEDVYLFTGFQNYYTSILRNQSDGVPETSLDLLIEGGTHADSKDADNYYFSGLSFSTVPLAVRPYIEAAETEEIFNAAVASPETRYSEPYTFERAINDSTIEVTQQLVSLCILEKDGSNWKIYQPALLPKIEHGTTEDSIVVTGDALLESNIKVEGIAEIAGDATIRSNLKVEDNINVGSLAEEEKADANNGGCIVARNNITAKENLIANIDISAGRNLTVDNDATIKTSLVVGERADTDSAKAGTITAKTHVETPTLNASIDITTPEANITTTLNVSNTSGTAQANIDKATITGELKVENSEATAKITANVAEVTGNLTVSGTITAEDNLTGGANNLVVNKADIETADINTLTGTTATIDDITGKNTVSSANIYQADYKVPIIELVQSGTEYQLKISRIGAKPQS